MYDIEAIQHSWDRAKLDEVRVYQKDFFKRKFVKKSPKHMIKKLDEKFLKEFAARRVSL
jgi:hypothetical protein